MQFTEAEFQLLHEAVCDRLADYVHHYPEEFVHNGGDTAVFASLYDKLWTEARRLNFWWAK